MLKKSNASAIVMSGIAVLSTMLTTLIWALSYTGFKIDLTAGNQAISPEDKLVLAFLVLAGVFVFTVPMGAFIIHSWDDSHFGIQGAIRWAVFGIVFGSLAQIRTLIPEGTVDRGLRSFLVEKGLSFGLGIIFLYLSHFVAFKLFKRKTNST